MLSLLLSLPLFTSDPPAPVLASDPTPGLWWGDADGDGRSDVLVLRPGEAPRLLAHLGDAGFVDVTESTGLAGLAPAKRALWADLDGDGDQDLLLTAPAPGGGSVLLSNNDGLFAPLGPETGLALGEGVLFAETLDLDGQPGADLYLMGPGRDRLYVHRGDLRFEELSFPASAASHLPPTLALTQGALGPLGTSSVVRSDSQLVTAATVGVLGVCPPSIEDAASGACLQASSVPMLGALYPLGIELNIDALGRVGINHTAPAHQLDVNGDIAASGQLVSTAASGAPLVVSSSDLVTGLNADQLDGFDASAFSQLGSLIEGVELAADAVDGSKIQDGSIQAVDLAPGAISTTLIQTDAVTQAQLAPGSVGGTEIQGKAVGSAHIAPDAITGALVADGSLTASDLAANSVGSSEIATNAVGASEIAANAVGASEIATDAVGQAEIAAGAVGSSEIAANAVDGLQVADGTLTALDLATNSVGSLEIATDAVGASEIAAGAVGASEIATGVVSSTHLLDGGILAGDIASQAINTVHIANGTITDTDVSASAAIAGSKVTPTFGAQDVTTTGDLGVGTTSPSANVHVVGSSLLGRILVTPNEPSSGDSSEVFLAEDDDGTFGMKVLYDGLNNRMVIASQVSGSVTQHVAVERDTGDVGIGVLNPSARLHVVDGAGGNSTVVLPNDAISAIEIEDEPGLANNKFSGSLSLSSFDTTLLSRTITCPTSGYLIATASVGLSDTLPAAGVSARLNLRTSTGSNGPEWYWEASPGSDGVLSFQRVFLVSTGSTTIQLRGRRATGQVTMTDGSLTLLFVPTAYGTVTL